MISISSSFLLITKRKGAMTKDRIKRLEEIEQKCKEVYDDNKKWVNSLSGSETTDARYWTMKHILKIKDKN